MSNQPGHNPRITVVNDNPEFLELMDALLEQDSGYDVTTIDADTLDDVEPIRTSQPDPLIIDLRWRRNGLTGWDVLRRYEQTVSSSSCRSSCAPAIYRALRSTRKPSPTT